MAKLGAAEIRAVAVDAYDARPDSISRLRHGATAIYRCETRTGDDIFLRFTHEDLISRRSALANAAFLEHLVAEGVRASGLVKSQQDSTVIAFGENGERFLATAVYAVPGRTLSRDDCEPAVFRAWGEAMASLHVAAERFEPADREGYLDEGAHWRECGESLPAADTLARAEWLEVDSWWHETALPLGDRGLTHADMNATNAIWDGAHVHLIDFDEPIWHVFASDLARPFREMDHQPAHARAAAKDALLAGYRSLRPLAAAWDEALPWLVRMKQMEMYAWTLRTGIDPSEPNAAGMRHEDFIAERRRDFERHARARR